MKKTLKRTLCAALIPIIILSTFATALSALAAKETPLHNEQDSIDFSEMNMITFLSKSGSDFYSNRDYSEGGDSSLATAYLSSWAGPVSEESDPYVRLRKEGAKYKKLKNVTYVDDIIHFDNSLSSVKSAVMEYGALYCSYSYTLDTYSGCDFHTPSYYSPGENISWKYHAVAVVGWDDNYPKENFPIQPQNNGAIICKNSWGTYSGYDGYIYISYEDKIFDPLVIDYDGFVAFTVADSDCGYNKIYQYDEYGANGYFNKLYDKIDYAFNVFPEQGKTLSSDETLKAVSFHIDISNTKYSVYLVEDYQKPEDAKLGAFNSKPVKIASGKAENPGYMVVDLDREYLLKAGTRFAILLKIDAPVNSSGNYAAEISYMEGVRGNRGESYYSSGNLIIDLYDSVENSNWSIKAFTNYKADDLMSQSNGKVNYFGIDNQNRKYSSSKVFSIEEIQELGGIISKDYIEYLKNPDGREIIPSPIDYVCETGSQKADTLPEKYDLRDYGYVSTVKDQGFIGSCWAHASLASLESNALKKYGSDGGIFKSYKTLEAREPYTVSISSPGARETFKFTATGSGEYTFTFGSNAEGTLYSPFGIAFETGKQSITYYVAKGDTVFLTVGLSDRASTGSITVSADTEMLYDESSKIRIEAGDTVKAKTSSNSYSIYSIESSSYFDGFYKISCVEELEITVNGRKIKPNEYNELEVYTNHKFYEDGDPKTYNLLVSIRSPKAQEVEFEIETVEYSEYKCKNCVDISLNETVHINYDDVFEAGVTFKFVPTEKSGFYYAEADGYIYYDYVFDSDKNQLYSEENKPGVFYLEKDNEYYFCVSSYGSGDFSIVEYDGSSHHIDLQKNEPVDDRLFSLNSCHKYSFTAEEEGYYRFVVQNISNFCHSILLNGNNPETIVVKSIAYIYTHFDEGERKTLEISCSKTEDEMYCFGDKYTVCVEKSEGTTLADDVPEISSGDTVQVSEMEPIYKFVCPIDGKLAFETELTCSENEIPDDMYIRIYNDEFDDSPFYDSTYITRLDLSTHIKSLAAEFEKGKTYYIVFYPYNASSFVFNIREHDYYESTEQDTLTVDNSVSVISLNSPINVPVEIVSPESNEYGCVFYLYVESIYYYCSLDFEGEEGYLSFVCVERKESEHGTFISKWVLCYGEPFDPGIEIKGAIIILDDYGDYKLRIEAEPYIPSNYIHLPETMPYKSTYKANAQGASKVIEWSSSNEDVAVIDKNGLITAKNIGSTIITATFEDGSVSTDTLYVKYAWWQMIIRILLLGFLWY